MNLVSAVVELAPRGSCPFDQISGRPAHAAFLDTLAKDDPTAAQQLHAAQQQKPFTVSPLWEGTPDNPTPRPVETTEPGRSCWFRVTALNAPTVKHVGTFVRMATEGLTLMGTRHDARAIYLAGALWARTTSYEDLTTHAREATSAARAPIVLHFLSPTMIKTKDANGWFPLPDLVFRHLAEKWRAFGPHLGSATEDLLADVASLARRTLTIEGYDVRTRIVHFGASPGSCREPFNKLGYLGRVEYGVAKDADPQAVGLLRMLADYAFFAGVGYRTPMGMGQVMPIPSRPVA